MPVGSPGPLGQNVKRLRESKGISQVALAVAAGVSQPFLSQLESGARADANAMVAQALARALGVTVDELLREGGA